MKKYFLISLLIFSLMPFSALAFNDQLVSDTSYQFSGSADVWTQNLGAGDGKTISQIKIRVGANQDATSIGFGYQTSEWGVSQCDVGGSNGWVWNGLTADASGYITVALNSASYFGNASSTSALLLPDYNYYCLRINKSEDETHIVQGAGTNVYANGQLLKWTSNVSSTITVVDAYFEFPNASSSVPVPYLNNPSDSEILADFDDWSIGLSYPSPIVGNIGVRYGRSTSTMTYADQVQYSFYVSANPLNVQKSQDLWYPPLATSTLWYAQSFLTSGTSTYYGDLISFTINEQATGVNAPPASFTTEIDCSGYEGGFFSSSTLPAIGCYAKQAAYSVVKFIFVPSQSSVAFLQNAYEDFKLVFPFSIFFSVTDTLEENVVNYSGSGANLNMTVQTTTGSSTSAILTPTTLVDAMGLTFTNWLYNMVLMVWLLILVGGIWKIIHKAHDH